MLPAVWGAPALDAADSELALRFGAEHAVLRPDVEAVRVAGDAIGVSPVDAALRQAREVYKVLATRVVPHELAEDAQLYQVLAGRSAEPIPPAP